MNNKAKINKKISLQTNAARADFQSRRRGCPSRTEDSLVLQNSLQAADQDRDREKRRRLSLSTDRLSHTSYRVFLPHGSPRQETARDNLSQPVATPQRTIAAAAINV